jgi:serine protease Do
MRTAAQRTLASSANRMAQLALAAICLTACIQTRAVHAAEDRRTPIVRAIEAVHESVVNIHGTKMLNPGEDPTIHGDGPRRVNGMGTGVVIDERGYILTNYHVVDGVQKIQVTLPDGGEYVAQQVSTDPTYDLAIIKIECPRKLPVIPIGTSSDLMVGESVIAVGNAYGYENTVTRGIVSALHRSVQVSDTQGYDDLIQTDASINPGNSGGPLFNIDGQMIGLNVAVRAGAQGIGFAIPVDKAMRVAAKLLSVERLENNWHGIVTEDKPGSPSELIVESVDKESPGAQVGLKTGDVITAVGKQEIARSLDFERALLGHKPGDALPLMIQRNDQSVKVNLVLAAMPARPAAEDDLAWSVLGLRLSPIDANDFKQYNSRYHGGMMVDEVRPGSPAARQGLRHGDVLVGIHLFETLTIDNVNWILTRPDFADLDPVKFYILRGGETLYGHFSIGQMKKVASR